jgi:hypothetical protein
MAEAPERNVRRVARRRYWRESDARVIVEAWRRSGEGLVQFARRYRVAPRRVERWAARLDEPPTNGMQFHPVRVVETEPSVARTPIEIELRDGKCVRVHAGFATDDLRRVLAVLEHVPRC